MEQIESNPTIPIKSVQDQLQKKFQLGVSKMKAFRAKAKATNLVRGDYKKQYTILRDYLEELQSTNPGTTIKLEVESNIDPSMLTRRFKRVYICLGPLKRGFKACGRDLLGLDGAFMKGPFPGQVLTAVGVDPNNGLYPVAYAIVESETKDSWTWFLECLGDDLELTQMSNFTFVTDRQKSLIPALAKVFPCAEHRFCLRHIHENMKQQWRGKAFRDLLWKCATAATVPHLEKAMEEMRLFNEKAYEWLRQIPPQHWSRSHFSEHETRRILLNIFKEKHRKSAEAGVIPSFYKKKPEDGSISHTVQRLAKYRFLKKQSDILLTSDDLDTMWLFLRENCIIDESTGSERVNYEDFCQIASLCTEHIGSKCRRFFCPSNFMKFEKDESGRISILSFYLYVMRTVSLTQARIDMSELDEDSDGFLQPYEMEAYIRGLIPNLAQLRDMPTAFVQMYCHIASHKFFFFCDPSRRGKACIKKILLSNCLQELMELHQESEGEDADQSDNWFSVQYAQRICDTFIDLDKDTNGTVSKEELQGYQDGTLTEIFIERAFDEHVRHGKTIMGNAWEMDFESFLDFVLALENKDTPEGLSYLFRCLDLHGRGYLTAADIHILFRDVREKWIQVGNYELCTEDVRDEIWDMVRPVDPLRITLADMLACKQGGTIASMLIDVRGFWAHDNREHLLQEDEEPYETDANRG